MFLQFLERKAYNINQCLSQRIIFISSSAPHRQRKANALLPPQSLSATAPPTMLYAFWGSIFKLITSRIGFRSITTIKTQKYVYLKTKLFYNFTYIAIYTNTLFFYCFVGKGFTVVYTGINSFGVVIGHLPERYFNYCRRIHSYAKF